MASLGATVINQRYEAAPGSRLSNKDAAVIGPELERLGWPRASELVEAARPKNSPLHRYLTWDDKVAGRKWREHQARHLMGAILTVVLREDGQEERIRGYHAVLVAGEPGGQRRYVPLEIVRGNADMASQVRGEAEMWAKGWNMRFAKYRHYLPEYEPVFQAVDNVLEVDRMAEAS